MRSRRTSVFVSVFVKALIFILVLAAIINLVAAVLRRSDMSSFLEADTPQVHWDGKSNADYPVVGGEDMILNASCDHQPNLHLAGQEPFPSEKKGDVWIIDDQPVFTGTLQATDGCFITIDSQQVTKVTAEDPRSFLELLTSNEAVFGSLIFAFLAVAAIVITVAASSV